MNFDILYILLPIWIGWIVQALLSALLAWKLNRLLGQPDKQRFEDFTPRATVIVPFRGVDTDLPIVVRSFCEQDYPDYRLVFVVDSPDDPAHKVLHAEVARYPQHQVEVIIAGAASMNEGQKIHNQLYAIDMLEQRCGDDEAWVFADSDARVGPQWLRRLVGPLAQKNVTGVVTGYRWLIPKQGNWANVWTHLASVINASVAVLYARAQFVRAWGGSMAILVGNARLIKLRSYLDGALTDDYQFTRACTDHGLRVYFVPQCLVATTVTFTRASLFNFLYRQYLITRVYALRLYLWALALTTLYVVGFLTAWIYLVAQLMDDTEPWRVWFPLSAIVSVFALNLWRTNRRSAAVKHAFGAEVRRSLRTTLIIDGFFTWLRMTIHWLVVVYTMCNNAMEWRGIFYRLYGPQDIRRMNRG